MSVSQRKGRRSAWLVKYKDKSGQWRQKQFRTEEEAREFDAQSTLDRERNEPLTVAEAVITYLSNHSLSDHTIGIYQWLVSGHDRKDGSHSTGPAEHLATRYVETLTRTDLESIRQFMLTRNVRPVTINAYTGKLEAVFSWCASEDLITKNPWSTYRNIPQGRTQHREGTLENLMLIYNQCPDWLKWAVQTAMALCLRPGIKELFSLEWSAFDWARETATVYMPKVGASKTVAVPTVFLHQARERYQKDAAAGKSIVCRNAADKQIRAVTQYSEPWDRACKRAGVHMPMYAIRHIAASTMLANGADLAAVASQLGHRNIATTGMFYAHALDSGKRNAARALPSIGDK